MENSVLVTSASLMDRPMLMGAKPAWQHSPPEHSPLNPGLRLSAGLLKSDAASLAHLGLDAVLAFQLR